MNKKSQEDNFEKFLLNSYEKFEVFTFAILKYRKKINLINISLSDLSIFA